MHGLKDMWQKKRCREADNRHSNGYQRKSTVACLLPSKDINRYSSTAEKRAMLTREDGSHMSLNIRVPDPKYIILLSDAIKGIMDLGVVVVCSAGNDGRDADSEDWEASTYPAALARTKLPLFFRIGAVDNSGVLPNWARQGDVYAPGVNALCANKDGLTLEEQSDGSSGATTSMAGLIAYEMGKASCPFEFSGQEADYREYQRIVKQYYTNGLGAYVRPGGVWRVAWNGLDGRASTICPLTVQKRDGEDQDPDEECAQPSSASSSTTGQTSASTFGTSISSTPTASSAIAVGSSTGDLLGGEIASLIVAAAIASSSSAAAAAAATSSLAAFAKAPSPSAITAAASSSIPLAGEAAAIASPSLTQTAAATQSPFPHPTNSPIPAKPLPPPLMCTQLYVSSFPFYNPDCFSAYQSPCPIPRKIYLSC